VLNSVGTTGPKCRILSFTRGYSSISYDYTFNNTPLLRLSTVRDLGVTFDARLSFAPHIADVAASAMKALGFLIRSTRNFASLDCIKAIYFLFVRSKLEYASLIFSPIYQNQIYALERVQRKFLKYIYFKNFL
jgi:hypothetical protein